MYVAFSAPNAWGAKEALAVVMVLSSHLGLDKMSVKSSVDAPALRGNSPRHLRYRVRQEIFCNRWQSRQSHPMLMNLQEESRWEDSKVDKRSEYG